MSSYKTSIDDLPPLSEVIKQFDLKAKKNLGQNFLLDLNITSKIAGMGDAEPGANVIEIGPGPGGLTRAILERGANLISIERDERFIPVLEAIQQKYPTRFKFMIDDALNIDYLSLAATLSSKPHIIANLPYNIGTRLLLNWVTCERWPPFYQSMTLMFQKEVAERIVAETNSQFFGRLSVLVNWRCRSKIIYNLPARAFTPPPKVDSAVVKISPIEQPSACNITNLQKITQLAFGQRRKMLRRSVQSIGGEELLKKSGINPELRAENLTIEQFIKLSSLI